MIANRNNGALPAGVTAKHLSRRAIVYMRQSSLIQVEKNTGSQLHQRGQEDFAKAFGWSEDRIEILDDDLGLSGTTADHRPGWKRMTELISAGLIGAIFMADISRLTRNLMDLLQFISLCSRYDVLLIVAGRVVDPRDSNDLFLSKLLGAVGEFENQLRTTRMREARYAKARQGKDVSRIPVGWVKGPEGVWDFDPVVKDVIDLVIKTFKETKTLLGTVRTLHANGVQLPALRAKGRIVWKRPSLDMVRSYLTSPNYAGVYIFGKSQSAPELGRTPSGHTVRRKLPESEWIITYNHHPAYMTLDEQQEIKAVLKRNAFPERQRPGRGEGLLQGLLTCECCGKRISVMYK